METVTISKSEYKELKAQNVDLQQQVDFLNMSTRLDTVSRARPKCSVYRAVLSPPTCIFVASCIADFHERSSIVVLCLELKVMDATPNAITSPRIVAMRMSRAVRMIALSP